MEFIVDVGNSLTGRTIQIEASTPRKAFELAKTQLDENKLEIVIQIRDDMSRFYYSNEFGFIRGGQFE